MTNVFSIDILIFSSYFLDSLHNLIYFTIYFFELYTSLDSCNYDLLTFSFFQSSLLSLSSYIYLIQPPQI